MSPPGFILPYPFKTIVDSKWAPTSLQGPGTYGLNKIMEFFPIISHDFHSILITH